jgi:hypothetical protein
MMPLCNPLYHIPVNCLGRLPRLNQWRTQSQSLQGGLHALKPASLGHKTSKNLRNPFVSLPTSLAGCNMPVLASACCQKDMCSVLLCSTMVSDMTSHPGNPPKQINASRMPHIAVFRLFLLAKLSSNRIEWPRHGVDVVAFCKFDNQTECMPARLQTLH